MIGNFDSDPAPCQLCFVARVFSHIGSFLSYATAGLLFQWPWSKLLCCQKVRVHILSRVNRILFELCIFLKDCFGVPLINLINLLEKCDHYSSTCSQFIRPNTTFSKSQITEYSELKGVHKDYQAQLLSEWPYGD